VALVRFKHQQALKQALQEARIQLEDRKQIDRAKAILINTRNFTENEAYHTLRKLAMDRNITLGQMARNVIAMAELLK
jgi:response regulator NasT